jgi:hypothetical protein
MNESSPLVESIAGHPSALGLHAPSPVYVTGEEALRMTVFANAAGLTVTLRARVLGVDGVVRPGVLAVTPNSNRTATTVTLLLSEGWLLGAEAGITAGTPLGNGVWGILELVRGPASSLTPFQMLTSDFISTSSPLFWPSEAYIEPLDGAGCLRSIAGTSPGAGAEVSETVPANARWELLAFKATFVTSAAVANRTPGLQLDDGTTAFWRIEPTVAQAASSSRVKTWSPGYGAFINGSGNLDVMMLLAGNRLGPGFRIRTSTGNIDVADQWSAVQYLVREWFDV